MATASSHPSHNVPLTSQVGGHAGVLTSDDGSLVIKPCLVQEKEFYTNLARTDAFESLMPWLPICYGTLKLEGELPIEEKSIEKTVLGEKHGPVETSEKETLVLENLSHSFYKANVLDVKLGTILWAAGADEAKRARMEKTAKETTSFETGVRLTGFQVFDPKTSTFVNTPKSYGKSIKAADLADGIARFFPVANDSDEPGVNAELLLCVIEGLLEDIKEITSAVEETEMRMVGGSLLIVWEGDKETLERAFARAEAIEEGLEEESEEESDEDVPEGEPRKKVGPPFVVRLIDFAHTVAAPGQGPDVGVLLGLKTVISLLEGRIEQVRKLSHPL